MKWSLRRRVEHFLKRTRMAPTLFGLRATGDPQFVFELRQGRAVRPPMEKKILAYLARAELEEDWPRRRRPTPRRRFQRRSA